MSATDLQTPIIDGAIRSTNFFNGRLLSARDLTLEQSANREADRRLGKAIGEGIAYGLEVAKPANFKKDSPVLSVDAGLAINRQGQTLMLRARTEVALVRTSTSLGASSIFSECLPLQTGAYVAGAGVYLLTIAPAQTFAGRAVTSAINPATTTCNTDTQISAVQFRLIQIDPALTPVELQDQNHLRNIVAYKCFGVTDQAAFVKDVLGGVWKKYGLLDNLRPTQLTDCEVPLAVLSWTDPDGVKFVDNWSVRRRLVRYLVAGHDPVSADETSPISSDAMVFASRTGPFVDERRVAEGLAMLLQFQEHLFALVSSTANPQNFVATNAFGLLPPAGLLPLRNTAHPLGFAYEKFFGNKSFAPPAQIDGAKLSSLLTESLHYPPIDLNGTERIQLYSVTENSQAQTGQNPPQPYIVFASEQLPYYSKKPRFATLCQTIRDAATVYLNMHNKGLVYSTESTGAGLTTRLGVISALQFVVNTASAQHVAVCGCSCGLSYDQALNTLLLLYTAQAQLVTALKADAAHAPTGTTEYTNALNDHLDVAVPAAPTNKPSLAAALIAKNLNAAVEAQIAINGLSFLAAGQSSTGNLRVRFTTSNKGRNLVPSIREPFTYTFRVENRMNTAVQVQLNAAFADRPTWNEDISTSVDGIDRSFINLQAFNPANPADPSTFADVVVSVMAPLSATMEETGSLRLTATVPKLGKSQDDTVNLKISDQLEDEPDSTIDFTAPMGASRVLTGVPLGGAGVTLTFTVRYHTTLTEANTRDFRLFALITSPESIAVRYQFTFKNKLNADITETQNVPAGLITATKKASKPVTLTNDVDQVIKITVVPQPSTGAVPSASGTTLTFNVRIESTTDNTLGKTDPALITITAA